MNWTAFWGETTNRFCKKKHSIWRAVSRNFCTVCSTPAFNTNNSFDYSTYHWSWSRNKHQVSYILSNYSTADWRTAKLWIMKDLHETVYLTFIVVISGAKVVRVGGRSETGLESCFQFVYESIRHLWGEFSWRFPFEERRRISLRIQHSRRENSRRSGGLCRNVDLVWVYFAIF